MSAWLDMADAIAARLKTLAVLQGAEVLVDRQLNIDSMVGQAMAKATGTCVTILWERAMLTLTEAEESEPTYSIRCYFRPILTEGALAADDVMEAVAAALTNWHPDPRAHYQEKLRPVDQVDLLTSKSYLIYEARFACRLKLPDPVFI